MSRLLEYLEEEDDEGYFYDQDDHEEEVDQETMEKYMGDGRIEEERSNSKTSSVPIVQKKRKKKRRKNEKKKSEHSFKGKVSFIEDPGLLDDKEDETVTEIPDDVEFELPVVVAKYSIYPVFNSDKLLRTNFGCDIFRSSVILHGGHLEGNLRRPSEQLLIVNLQDSTVKDITKILKKDKRHVNRKFPKMKAWHKLYLLQYDLILLNGCGSVWILRNHFSLHNPGEEKFAYWESLNIHQHEHKKKGSSQTFWNQPRQNRAGGNHAKDVERCCIIKDSINTFFIFGGSFSSGSASDNLVNQLVKIRVEYGRRDDSNLKSIVSLSRELLGFVHGIIRPPPRAYCSGISDGRGKIYIFGGLGSRNTPLNDLWCWDESEEDWVQQVHRYGLPPPALVNSSITCLNSGKQLLIYGGLGIADEGSNFRRYEMLQVQKTFYRFHVKRREWSIILPLSENPLPRIQGQYFLRSTSTSSFVVGGMIPSNSEKTTSNSIKSEERRRDSLVPMKYVYRVDGLLDKGTNMELIKFLEDMRRDKTKREYLDLRFIVSGKVDKSPNRKDVEEEEEEEVKTEVLAHKCIVSCRSEYLYQEIELEGSNSEDGFTELRVSGYSHEVVDCYINFLYCGKVELHGKENLEQLLLLSTKWGHAEDLKDIVFYAGHYGSGRVTMRMANRIVERLRNDFSKLIPSAIDMKKVESIVKGNSGEEKEQEEEDDKFNFLVKEKIDLSERMVGKCNYFSDLRIIHKEKKREDEEAKLTERVFFCHKVFLCRSAFVYKCLHAGMIEEIESKLIFENNLTIGGLESVLKYIYTDEICGINFSTAVECHIFGLLFQIPNICSICRNIIMDLVDVETVIDLLNVFDMYQDKVIVSHLVKFVTSNFDTFEKRLDELASTGLRKTINLNMQRLKEKQWRKKKKEALRLKNMYAVQNSKQKERAIGQKHHTIRTDYH